MHFSLAIALIILSFWCETPLSLPLFVEPFIKKKKKIHKQRITFFLKCFAPHFPMAFLICIITVLALSQYSFQSYLIEK